MRELTHKTSRAVAAVLFPDTCLACRMHVAERGTLCPKCWNRLHFIAEPICAVTGFPFQHDFGNGMVSAEALADPPAYRRARAAVLHSGIARQLVQRLKYGDRTELAPWMARWMLRAGSELVEECDVVVPVPLHPRRFLARRYNQAAELGRTIATRTGLAFEPGALRRVKPTRQQVGLTANERKLNVRGAFRVPPEREIAVAGRDVLLVDDVFTTGATIEAATKALLRGGASHVDVLTFSHVVPHFAD
ncbi:ComF family protein [Oricola sp.]|uniref:ComF family protein n=1 Tax=Oricola sp. TaxID=1979950 RepID=UPI0025FD88A9|nr:ComF family protein [Oricola sp.]MCI5075279.1 ComF family protein [Oricola sp.]